MRRADFADQRGGGVDMVGVDLCGADRDTGARLHRLGDRVAFEPASTRQRDVGEDIGILGHLVHRDRTAAARADPQLLPHSKTSSAASSPLSSMTRALGTTTYTAKTRSPSRPGDTARPGGDGTSRA